MRVIVPLMLLLSTVSAFAGGFSLGFKEVEVPYLVTPGLTHSSVHMADLGMLRLGSALSPEFRIEVLLGYGKNSYEDEVNDAEYSTFAIGGSGFYVIARPSNSVFAIGGSLIYAKSNNGEDVSTSDLTLLPVMRADYAVPGMSDVAFFSEFGLRYDKATTTDESDPQDLDFSYSHFGTYASPHVLGGVYYSF
ncbi:MAG: hypothetical protein IT351_08615 [Candidatus Fermentibacter sp.]|nr:hypothetical protein [Candidatus Fermentibacter sp.]